MELIGVHIALASHIQNLTGGYPAPAWEAAGVLLAAAPVTEERVKTLFLMGAGGEVGELI